MSTIKRGRVLRDTSAGEGLVFVDGNQYAFRLEGVWKSEYAPKVNMGVEAEFDEQGRLMALRSVSASGVAGEQAAQALGAAQESAKRLAAELQAKGLPAFQQYAQRIGYPVLAAFVALIIGWFFLAAVSVDLGFMGRNSVTFWQGLKFLNSGAAAALGGGSTGFYGLLCIAALLAVVLPQVWPNPRARYGMAAPLALMLLVLIVAYAKVPAVPQGAEEFAAEFRKAVSLGLGTYLAFAAAIYLAWKGLRAARNP
ncbi:MAG TPA: hypothetical protein PKL49_11920 [Steroidobacteraceae bacterium]|nr:hypothetical protein [Steroidobacteraceae bacterium]